MSDRDLLARAKRIVALAAELSEGGRRAQVVVNDRPDIAVLSGADGIHVGQEDLTIADIRRIVGPRMIIGVSTSNIDEARAAVRDGADCCGVGPMFPTATKHKPLLAGPTYLQAYLADEVTRGVPHLAIGGITPERARELAAMGCRGVAVSSAVCGAREPGEVVREILSSLL